MLLIYLLSTYRNSKWTKFLQSQVKFREVWLSYSLKVNIYDVILKIIFLFAENLILKNIYAFNFSRVTNIMWEQMIEGWDKIQKSNWWGGINMRVENGYVHLLYPTCHLKLMNFTNTTKIITQLA